MAKIWVVEGNFMGRGWEAQSLHAKKPQAIWEAHRWTQGLFPVWKYRFREYAGGRPSPIVRYSKSKVSTLRELGLEAD